MRTQHKAWANTVKEDLTSDVHLKTEWLIGLPLFSYATHLMRSNVIFVWTVIYYTSELLVNIQQLL